MEIFWHFLKNLRVFFENLAILENMAIFEILAIFEISVIFEILAFFWKIEDIWIFWRYLKTLRILKFSKLWQLLKFWRFLKNDSDWILGLQAWNGKNVLIFEAILWSVRMLVKISAKLVEKWPRLNFWVIGVKRRNICLFWKQLCARWSRKHWNTEKNAWVWHPYF